MSPDARYAAVPEAMRHRKAWLLWKSEQHPGDKKPRKVPYYADGRRRAGEQGAPADRAALVSFEAALAALDGGGFTGLGFAFLPGNDDIGIDLDHVRDPETGKLTPRAQAIVDACASYTEISPSGTGLHIYCQGESETFKSNDIGVEVFCGRQFFTVTGHHLVGTPAEVNTIGEETLRRLKATVEQARKGRDSVSSTVHTSALDGQAKVESALAYVSPDCGYDDWIRIGMAIHAELGPDALGVWDAWSGKSAKYPGSKALAAHWKSFGAGGVTGASLYALAGEAGWRSPRRVHTPTPPEPRSSSLDDPDAPRGHLDPLAPPIMAPEGLPPLLREIVETATATSEAHPVAVAFNVMAMFSCMIGRGPHQWIGDTVIHARPFGLVVGKSGKARKGTAEHTPMRIFRAADELLRQRRKTGDRLRIHAGGLSTGEGIVYAIRDAREGVDGKDGDPGVNDKRLLVVEPEFDNVLAHTKREGNTLSATIRNLWDGRDLEPMSKSGQKSGERATRPHVVVLGHITGFELREKSTENDAANGLLNRFLILYVHRPKLVPLPEPTPETRIQHLAERVADAIEAATDGNYHTREKHEIRLGEEARELWIEQYPQLSRDREGKAGSLMARAEVYCRMLAMVFCLLDARREIEPCDLRAALAWVDYWRQSVDYIFRMADEDGELDPFAARVFELIRAEPGITAEQLRDRFHRNEPAGKIKRALENLVGMAPPLIEARKKTKTGGRPATCYHPYNSEQSIDAESRK